MNLTDEDQGLNELAVITSTTKESDKRFQGFSGFLVQPSNKSVLDRLSRIISNYALSGSIFLVLAFGTAGCGLPKRELAARSKLGGKMSLQVITSSMANQNSPVAVDIVMVSDKKLLDVLAGLTASDWFQKRDQIQLDHPGKIKVLTDLELVPGQSYGPIKLRVGPQFVGGVLFMNYFTPGAHRAVIDIRKPLVVNLLENDFAIQPEK